MAFRNKTADFMKVRGQCLPASSLASDAVSSSPPNTIAAGYMQIQKDITFAHVAIEQYMKASESAIVIFDPITASHMERAIKLQRELIENLLASIRSQHIAMSQLKERTATDIKVQQNMVVRSAETIIDLTSRWNAVLISVQSKLAAREVGEVVVEIHPICDEPNPFEQEVRHPHHNKSTGSIAQVQNQQGMFQWNEEDSQKTLRIAKTVDAIHQDQIFLHSMMYKQGEQVNHISHHIMHAQAPVQKGLTQLKEAEKITNSGCRWFGIILLVLVLAMFLQLVVLIWTHS